MSKNRVFRHSFNWALVAALFCQSAIGDTCTTNAGCLMLHTNTPGRKEVFLPGARKVRNALTGELAGESVVSFTEELPENVTRIYELSSPAEGP